MKMAKESICGHLADSEILEDRWKLLEKLGSGAFGCVALASDTVLKRKVAIKFGEIGENEVKHQKIAATIGIAPQVIAERKDYFVMDYIEGPLLRDAVVTPKIREDLECAKTLLDSIKIKHPDMHGDNIKLAGDGKVMLLDYGLTKKLKINETNLASEKPPVFAECVERYKVSTPGHIFIPQTHGVSAEFLLN